jgi:hypothetical protein
MSQIPGGSITSTFREWREFRRQTGVWPVFSVLMSGAFFCELLVGTFCYIVYADHKGWSDGHTKLLAIPLVLIYVTIWSVCERVVRMYEIKRTRAHIKRYFLDQWIPPRSPFHVLASTD